MSLRQLLTRPHSGCCSEGGFFNALLTFPTDYPQSPPTCRFTSDMWHPNGEDAPELSFFASWSGQGIASCKLRYPD